MFHGERKATARQRPCGKRVVTQSPSLELILVNAEFTGDFIAWERPPETYLTELQPKLRCTQCGNRVGNMFTVGMAARD